MVRRARFLDPLHVEEIDDGHWRLLDALCYDSAVLDQRIKVPKGFVTDYASVPRLPLAYWLTGGTACKPAVIHDFLYQTRTTSRAEADAVFREAMEVDGTAWWRRWMMWSAVRSFGWTVWRSADERITRLSERAEAP